MLARRKLIELWKGDPSRVALSLDYHRELAADTMDAEDVSAYGAALIAAGNHDGGRVAIELAATLGKELDNDEVAFLGTHPVRMMAEDEPYRGAMEPDDRAELLADDGDEPLTGVFAALWEAAPLLWADTDAALAAIGATGADRLGGTSDIPAAAVFTRVARALRAPATVLFADHSAQAADIKVACVSPPVIVMGPNVLGSGDEQPSELELRFLLARAAELSRPERIFAQMDPDALEELVASLGRAFTKGNQATTSADERLRKTLPVKVRQRLSTILRGGIAGDAAARYRAASQRVANRAGLLICGDLDTAVRWARTRGLETDTRYLERMVLSPRYLEVRARLGIGVRR
jgi:hypothetical protein